MTNNKRTLLSIDFSTTATGWAKFDLDTNALLEFGVIEPDFKNPKKKGSPGYVYPQLTTLKLRRLADQVLQLADSSVEKIVIEEINRGKSRLGQKVLDMGHGVLLERMPLEQLKLVSYFDSDGSDGWRSAFGLNLRLSEKDKLLNKDRKKTNKKIGKGQKKLHIITQKTLACKYANKVYGLSLDDAINSTDADVADAIGLGAFYLSKIYIGEAHDQSA